MANLDLPLYTRVNEQELLIGWFSLPVTPKVLASDQTSSGGVELTVDLTAAIAQIKTLLVTLSPTKPH